MPQDVLAASGAAITATTPQNLGTIVVKTGSKVGTSTRQIRRDSRSTNFETIAVTGLTEKYLDKWDSPRFYSGDAAT